MTGTQGSRAPGTLRPDHRAEIVIFGAGSIGRGFLGQIFGRSGWAVTFVDADSRLVTSLNQHHTYSVDLVSPDGTVERVGVENVHAIEVSDNEAITAALKRTPYVGTSVGAGVLPAVARQIASSLPATELAQRDIILAENLHDAFSGFTRHLTDDGGESTRSPGVHACAVGKMTPESSDAADGTLVTTEAMNDLLVDAADWKNPIPSIAWLKPVQPIAAYIDRKLFLHNLMHAALAFMSTRICPECQYIHELLDIDRLVGILRELAELVSQALAAEYPDVLSVDSLRDHSEDLLHRFSSRRLGDSILRVGRDVPRKLQDGERVVGALRLLERHSLAIEPVLSVYEAALEFGIATEQITADDLRGAAGREFVARITGSDLSDTLTRALNGIVERAGVPK